MVWNMFACIGISALTIVVLLFFNQIRQKERAKRCNELARIVNALCDAVGQPRDEAVKTLANVGISYNDDNARLGYSFKVPESFWGRGGIEEKARAFVTIVTHDDKYTSNHGTCQTKLLSLLVKRAKTDLGMVLAIICELKKIAGDNSLFENFFSRLPFAERYID
jgi:hypothetical protein